jgi:hypothetical protein
VISAEGNCCSSAASAGSSVEAGEAGATTAAFLRGGIKQQHEPNWSNTYHHASSIFVCAQPSPTTPLRHPCARALPPRSRRVTCDAAQLTRVAQRSVGWRWCVVGIEPSSGCEMCWGAPLCSMQRGIITRCVGAAIRICAVGPLTNQGSI